MPNNETDFQYQMFHVIKIILFLGEVFVKNFLNLHICAMSHKCQNNKKTHISCLSYTCVMQFEIILDYKD